MGAEVIPIRGGRDQGEVAEKIRLTRKLLDLGAESLMVPLRTVETYSRELEAAERKYGPQSPTADGARVLLARVLLARENERTALIVFHLAFLRWLGGAP